MTLNQIVEQPIFFNQNRVYRNYTGAAGYTALTGVKSVDSSFPEEWIASVVRAINPEYFGRRDGVSTVENTDILFDDLIKGQAGKLLGGRKYDCLVKFLDSAIRLPVQTHPTPDFSRKFFNSNYGKTEAWLVLATRSADAKLYFGFKDKIDLATLKEYADRSLNERDVLTDIITAVPAKVGDVYLIRAGLIHAIGAGCTILEVQEPTDFTIQIENWCGNSRVSEAEKYLGLPRETAMKCFNFNAYGEKAVEHAKITPRRVYHSGNVTKEVLISYADTPCFSVDRYTLNDGEIIPNYGTSVWVIIDGKGTLTGKDYSRNIKSGDYFFLPYAAEGKFKLSGTLTAIRCLSSK